MKYFYLTLGIVFVVIGIVGIFLPLLPTTPFLLLATWCFSKSSHRFHQWLLNHPRLGPPVLDWQRDGVIRKPAKLLVTLMTAATLGVSFGCFELPKTPQIILPLIMLGVLVFIWTRPSQPR